MPLLHGSSDAVFRTNVAEMIRAGHPRDQALAAAYRQARQGRAAGGSTDDDHPMLTPDAELKVMDDAQARLAHGTAYGFEGKTVGEIVDDADRFNARHRQLMRERPGASGSWAAGGTIDKALHAAKGYAFGGISPPPYFARQEARQMDAPDAGGVIQSEIPGRTDHIPANPLTGTYILPSAVVAGLGEDNTLAGAHLLDMMLNTGPWGTKLPRMGHHDTIPRPPRLPPPEAKGGGVEDGGGEEGRVPILMAGGEYKIPPWTVMHHPLLGNLPMNTRDPKLREMALKRGHSILDQFVKTHHKKHGAEISALPGPSK